MTTAESVVELFQPSADSDLRWTSNEPAHFFLLTNLDPMNRKLRSVFLSIAVLVVLCLILAGYRSVQANQVRSVALQFRDSLENKDLNSAYAKMSHRYTNQLSLNRFEFKAVEYSRKLALMSGSERVRFHSGLASVYVPSSSQSKVGFTINLVYENEWRIDSLDGFWMEE